MQPEPPAACARSVGDRTRTVSPDRRGARRPDDSGFATWARVVFFMAAFLVAKVITQRSGRNCAQTNGTELAGPADRRRLGRVRRRVAPREHSGHGIRV